MDPFRGREPFGTVKATLFLTDWQLSICPLPIKRLSAVPQQLPQQLLGLYDIRPASLGSHPARGDGYG